MTPSARATFDLQGHRGARGLAPENTLAAFSAALAIGVTTLETDLAVTRDDHLVLSHDPLLNPDITRGPSGRWIAARGPAIHALSLAELKAFDVGRIDPTSEYSRRFPHQVPVDGSRIPTLAELFTLGEASGKAPRYNIETKISPLSSSDTPDAEAFSRLVIDAVRGAKLQARVTVQSFDWRTLLAVKRLAPEITTVGLTIDTPEESNMRRNDGAPSAWLGGIDTANPGATAPELVKAAGCSVWSPYWENVDAESLRIAHALSLQVLPWTINEPADIARLIDLGVDGLITDYPDRARAVMKQKNIELC